MSRTRCAFVAVIAMVAGIPSACGWEVHGPAGPVKLETLSGKAIVMNNYQERPATGVVFLSGRCDITAQAMGEINRIHQKFRLRDVLFVGVCTNSEETGDELRTFAQRRGIIFPLYRDPQGQVARQFAARTTPDLFLLDPGGKLVFHGGLGDGPSRKAAEAAIDKLLRHEPIDVQTVASEGTPIDRPGPKREINDPYGTISFSSELVFEKIPSAPAHHCSTICETSK
ncbi:MAG TPA: redoxin domain-containing protein, partial [Pirellulales bacterium]|nr:redoxin domain-containing protein [Pirellulales bacterium]